MLTLIGVAIVALAVAHIALLSHRSKITAPLIGIYGAIACLAGLLVANIDRIQNLTFTAGQLDVAIRDVNAKAAEVEQVRREIRETAKQVYVAMRYQLAYMGTYATEEDLPPGVRQQVEALGELAFSDATERRKAIGGVDELYARRTATAEAEHRQETAVAGYTPTPIQAE